MDVPGAAMAPAKGSGRMGYDNLARRHGWGIPPKAYRLMTALAAAILWILIAALFAGDTLVLRHDMLWNVFLALLPLLFSMLVVKRDHQGKKGPLAALWWGLWLVFYPNAPYMATDLIHLSRYAYNDGGIYMPSIRIWLGFIHIAGSALTGCLLGWLSLYLLHSVVRKRRGATAGWLFAAGAGLLSGFAIYVGRFLRFNSWDVLRPHRLLEGLLQSLGWHAVMLALLFFVISFGGYVIFYLCFDDGGTQAV